MVSQVYMLTGPRNKINKRMVKIMLEEHDIHKWVVAMEEGRKGYKHWQIRLQASNPPAFEAWVLINIPEFHIEKASDTWKYEKKEGRFWTSWEFNEARACRFGKLNSFQKAVVARLQSQNDRQVDVWYDPAGNHGKSWLSTHLADKGEALIVPRGQLDPEAIQSYICFQWAGERIIIIDIPRSSKIPKGFYECVELIKDGWLSTTKWEGRSINCRGVRVAVFTNQPLSVENLSRDRWRFNSVKGFTVERK